MTWTAPTTDDLHPVDSYVVRWKCSTDDYGASRVAEGITVLTHTITGLINGTECTVKVNAKNTIGEGAVSNDPSETPGDEPSPARSLAITPHHNELVVTWQEPADDGQRQLLWPLCANYFGRSGSGVIVACNCRSSNCRPCASLVR